MASVLTSLLGDKHAPWLAGFGCLACGGLAAGVGGWEPAARSGDQGSHPIPARPLSACVIFEYLKLSNLKSRGLKAEEPRGKSFQLWSSLVL